MSEFWPKVMPYVYKYRATSKFFIKKWIFHAHNSAQNEVLIKVKLWIWLHYRVREVRFMWKRHQHHQHRYCLKFKEGVPLRPKKRPQKLVATFLQFYIGTYCKYAKFQNSFVIFCCLVWVCKLLQYLKLTFLNKF